MSISMVFFFVSPAAYDYGAILHGRFYGDREYVRI